MRTGSRVSPTSSSARSLSLAFEESMMHRLRRRFCVLLLAAVWVSPARAQTAQTAPIDRLVDRFVLDTQTVTAGDLSADGQWIVTTTGSLRDRIGIDNS